jgi:predicted XRE-type DNA-binding protein
MSNPKDSITSNSAVELGSGNVFADLGLPDADERKLRTQLALRLNEFIAAEGLTQLQAAKRLGIAQPHVSELKNYKLARFSSERLLHYITLFSRDVEIFIKPCAQPATASKQSARVVGAVSVWAAS